MVERQDPEPGIIRPETANLDRQAANPSNMDQASPTRNRYSFQLPRAASGVPCGSTPLHLRQACIQTAAWHALRNSAYAGCPSSRAGTHRTAARKYSEVGQYSIPLRVS